MRVAAALAGVAGGLCWIAGAWIPIMAWPGAVLLAIAVLGTGAALVSRTANWLRLLVAVCFLALVASLLALLRESVDRQVLLIVAGAIAAAVGAVVLAQSPPGGGGTRGAHAA